MVERVRKTYWEWGGGRKRGGMERKERERMVVRDKQDGGGGNGWTRWMRSETDGRSECCEGRFDQKMTAVANKKKNLSLLSHPPWQFASWVCQQGRHRAASTATGTTPNARLAPPACDLSPQH